ncbi:MAG TPA: 2Fe-2S iron-sulfur cluster binding domain-containing protein [Symbiobacteriaceae bacterium]|jgi:ferredoxin
MEVAPLADIRVTVQTKAGEHTVLVPPRANLLQSLLAAGLPYRWGCAQATCGKCQCQVLAGAENLQRPTVNEPARLSQTLVDMGFRLACQVKVLGPGDVIIRQR